MDPAAPAVRREDHDIAPGVRGWLESPMPTAGADDCVLVTGWAFAASPIIELWAEIGGDRTPVRHGIRRADVAAVYPAEPHALESGFSAFIEFDRAGRRLVPLVIRGRTADGRTIQLFARNLARRPEASLFRYAAGRVAAYPGLLLSPRAWRHAWSLATGRGGRLRSTDASRAIEAFDRSSRTQLDNFLASGARLVLPAADDPVVSVVIVAWNHADLTFGCLRALSTQSDVAFEVIVVDNGSTDDTRTLLDRIDHGAVVRQSDNVGFTVGANAGARRARGEFLLFLNNDAELLPGAIRRLLETARSRATVGAVGGKLVFPDGRLQEAGSIIWSDGSCDAYGRGGDPLAGEFMFERPVDFCSAAMLLTPRALFEELRGFDERYKPAYYEDADYCARVWMRGHAVVYQPRAVAIHREFGSATSPRASVRLQLDRRHVFAEAHRDWLSSQRSRGVGLLTVRTHPHGTPSLVVVDDAAPNRREGAGFPRAAEIVRAFQEFGYSVTICATGDARGAVAAQEELAAVEVIATRPHGLQAFFDSRRDAASIVVVSRPHNMQYVKAAVGGDLSRLGAPCIYDAEAVFAVRDAGRCAIDGHPLSESQKRAAIDAELTLARGCSAVLVVSDNDRQVVAPVVPAPVFVASHALEATPTQTPAARRHSILFVGAFAPGSPNDAAARYLTTDVLPALRRRRCEAPLVIAGARASEWLAAVGATPGVVVHSDVEDLTPLYEDARVFVAPMRYGAGIPLKVLEAAAFGVPIVASTLVARQLGWRHGVELLAVDAPDDVAGAIVSVCADGDRWSRLREAALAAVIRDFNRDALRSALRHALEAARRSRSQAR